jgi:hypothetical protein
MSKQQWIAENLKPGEEYAGLMLGKYGSEEYHLVLLPQRVEGLTWKEAMAWARESGVNMPTRQEQMLLFVNLKARFDPLWYWSSETYGAPLGFAWGQTFDTGDQIYARNFSMGHARAIRRVPLEGGNNHET